MKGLITTQITTAGHYKNVIFGKQTFLPGEI